MNHILKSGEIMAALSSRKVDMLTGPILPRIITFSLPIFLGSVFQQLYNMVDSIVVGKYVSADALAAVGSTGTVSMLLVGIMMGFPTGASVVAAQFLGAGEKKKIRSTISTTLIFLLGLAVVLTILGLALSHSIMTWVNVPENIFEDAVTYFRIFIGGMIFMALYNFFASFLRALGDSTTPLIFLVISSLLNIGGDLLFVIAFDMGVAGVAWATIISQAISVVLCFFYVTHTSEYFHFSKGELLFDRMLFRDILRLGLPASLQSSITSLGMIAVQGLINSYGSVCMAAYTSANKMESLSHLPVMGISMAVSLFTGQNIGAKQVDRARKGLVQSLLFTLGLSIIMAGIIILTGPYLMRLFVNDTDADVISIGADFMKIWAPIILFHATAQSFVAFLRGAGDSIASMIAMFFDLGVRTAAAYFFAIGLDMGFMGIAYSIPCGWVACAAFAVIRYLTGAWKDKAVI